MVRINQLHESQELDTKEVTQFPVVLCCDTRAQVNRPCRMVNYESKYVLGSAYKTIPQEE